MARFVLAFRAVNDGPADPEQEAAWADWFGRIGGSVVDFGARIGERKALGSSDHGDGKGLSGYIVIEAADMDAAIEVARGCPNLTRGGGVEVGAVMTE